MADNIPQNMTNFCAEREKFCGERFKRVDEILQQILKNTQGLPEVIANFDSRLSALEDANKSEQAEAKERKQLTAGRSWDVLKILITTLVTALCTALLVWLGLKK